MHPLLHLLALAAAGAAALPAAAAPGQQPGGLGWPACDADSACAELEALPLQPWSQERAGATATRLPWGALYAFQPLDYASLAAEVCACLRRAPKRECTPAKHSSQPHVRAAVASRPCVAELNCLLCPLPSLPSPQPSPALLPPQDL